MHFRSHSIFVILTEPPSLTKLGFVVTVLSYFVVANAPEWPTRAEAYQRPAVAADGGIAEKCEN